MMAVAGIAVIGIGCYWSDVLTSDSYNLSAIELANIEALSENESYGYGCGYAAYEWDDDWYEDTKCFTKCVRGCPEKSGTSPKYTDCK